MIVFIEKLVSMLLPPRDYNLSNHILTNNPQGSPTRVNMYKTYGYFADKPLYPLEVLPTSSKYYGTTLTVNIQLSKEGHIFKRKTIDPTTKDIIIALKKIEHGEYHSFVILSKSKEKYLQANVYCLEYRDGSKDDHYHCPPEFLSSMTVLKAFVSYAQNCSWWENKIPWREAVFSKG